MADGSRGPIDEDVLREVRLQAECRDVAEWMGFRRGGHRRYYCPSCQGPSSKTPDLSTPPHGGFKCHKCNAKGDAIALVMLAHRCTFVEAVEWLAERCILPRRISESSDVSDSSGAFHVAPQNPESLQPNGTLQSRVERSQDETEEAVRQRWHAWHAAVSRHYPGPEGEDTAAAWLDSRGIPDARLFVESGFVLLDRDLAVTSEMRRISGEWLEQNIDHALVFPVRSAATNAVVALHARSLIFDDGRKRRQVGKWQDPDGTPRGYGWAGAWKRAEVLVLCEGASDMIAAEAMTRNDPRIVAIGAENAKALTSWATFMKSNGFGLQGFDAHCCIVWHLDDNKSGLTNAKSARDILGKELASAFDWRTFLHRLDEIGLDLSPYVSKALGGFDLAEVLTLAKKHGVSFESVQKVFLEMLPLK